MEIPCTFEEIKNTLLILREKYLLAIRNSTLLDSSKENATNKLLKLSKQFEFCLYELGIWLAAKAVEAHSCEPMIFTLGGRLMFVVRRLLEISVKTSTTLTHLTYLLAGWFII
ncbi:hypothetical protein HanXRQr2_Chr11g0505491 [Helianthus annuus]|uniref:Uncharacterized protein n=1 Tax=Helianthus annuus TaxID=4232 RepID=A0A9K3HRN2_HELAN|nr:hypothetical protein HanXRQr2_Chr11g0505491 [Helianthus annuus]